jgi:hypothetical protein
LKFGVGSVSSDASELRESMAIRMRYAGEAAARDIPLAADLPDTVMTWEQIVEAMLRAETLVAASV